VGEGEVTAVLVGSLFVPTTLVTVDGVVLADMRAVVPDIETSVVKTSLSRYAGHDLPLERTHAILKEAATRALHDLDRGEPFVYGGAVEVEVLCDTGHHAQVYADTGVA
jgi:D-aminopeptidase